MQIASRIFLSLCFLFAARQSQAALFLNETFNISLGYSSAAFNVFEGANTTLNVTFADGASTNLGASAFNPAVNIVVDTFETVLTPTSSTIQIQILGDLGGVLANPLSPTTLASDGTPFTNSFVDLGAFNAAGDELSPSAGPFPSNWQVTGGVFGIVSTSGDVGILTLDPALDVFSSPPDGIAVSGGFDFGGNLATLDMSTVSAAAFPNGGQFAGWIVQMDVTSVPEPSCASVPIRSPRAVQTAQKVHCFFTSLNLQ